MLIAFDYIDTVTGELITGTTAKAIQLQLQAQVLQPIRLHAALGIPGPQGLKGDTGEQGIQGLRGEQGIQGIQGIQGPVAPDQWKFGGNLFTDYSTQVLGITGLGAHGSLTIKADDGRVDIEAYGGGKEVSLKSNNSNVKLLAGQDIIMEAGGSERFKINGTTGSIVGISLGLGVTPAAPLHVYSSVATIQTIERSTASSNVALEFKNATAGSWFVGKAANSNFAIATINALGNAGAQFTMNTSGVASFLASVAAPQVISPLIIGGTSPTSTVIIQATSGSGITGSGIFFKVGNAGAIDALQILNSGSTLFPNQGTASSNATQQGSSFIALRASGWTGSVQEQNEFRISYKLDTTQGINGVTNSGGLTISQTAADTGIEYNLIRLSFYNTPGLWGRTDLRAVQRYGVLMRVPNLVVETSSFVLADAIGNNWFRAQAGGISSLYGFSSNVGFTGPQITLAASTATNQPITIPHGIAPTTPTNGSVWTTAAGMFVRINGVTKQVAFV